MIITPNRGGCVVNCQERIICPVLQLVPLFDSKSLDGNLRSFYFVHCSYFLYSDLIFVLIGY